MTTPGSRNWDCAPDLTVVSLGKQASIGLEARTGCLPAPPNQTPLFEELSPKHGLQLLSLPAGQLRAMAKFRFANGMLMSV